MEKGRYRLGVDIGGTFTDVILMDEATGKRTIGKILTSSLDPSMAAVDGVREQLAETGVDPEEVLNIIHGTTLVTNLIIERKGARAGLITTAGFRDVLEIRRESRYDMYNLFLEMPEPLVPRRLRMEVTERMDEKGAVLTPLNEEEVVQAVEKLLGEGVEAVAVCFLHSFMNGSNEQRAAEIIERLAPDLSVSISSEVVPEIREFERTSTTVANAYAQPTMTHYLSGFGNRLKELGFGGDLLVMLSNGGITTCETAQRFPVRALESGPAAGAIAAAYYGKLRGEKRLLSFDMGGTTAKACFIEDGKPLTTTNFEVGRAFRFKKGSGLPINLPVVEMIEIGAGGGSIARADKLGLLKVGPDSAGANPGPACYGMGGELPTVTDADLVLGYLDPAYFLGGKMDLDVECARRSIEAHIAVPLGMELEEAALGIHQVVNENMANATRVHAMSQGRDPASHTLIAFGGAGPVHAYDVARRLGVGTIVYPPGAGVTSALGLLAAPFAYDLVRSHVTPLDDIDLSGVNALFEEMELEGAEFLRSAGISDEEMHFQRSANMRYVGQRHEIEVPIPGGKLEKRSVGDMKRGFDEQYVKLYARVNPDAGIEALNWRVVVSGPEYEVETEASSMRSVSQPAAENAFKGKRKAYFQRLGGYTDCPVYDRYRMSAGHQASGPAIIEERESTLVLGPGCAAVMDDHLNLVVQLEKS